MKPFFHAQRTRFTAVVVLFVWGVALAMGMANACLIPQGASQHPHSSPMDTSAADTHAPTQRSDAALCLDVCAVEQATWVKAKQQFDGSVGVAAVPAHTWPDLAVAGGGLDASLRTAGVPNWPELSVAIRFSRRTI